VVNYFTGKDTVQVVEVLLQNTNNERKPGRRILTKLAARLRLPRLSNQLRVTELRRNTAARLNDEADARRGSQSEYVDGFQYWSYIKNSNS